MPGLDRTGPRGEGPMTGRGLGYCAEKVQDLKDKTQQPINRPLRVGRAWGGPGRGLGRRRRRGWR